MNLYPDDELMKYSSDYNKKFDEDKILLFSDRDLIGQVANWSIRLSPKVIPDNLNKVLEEFCDHINPYFDNLNDDFRFMEMSLKNLKKFIHGNLITINEFKEWNLSEYEKKLNIKINDKNRDKFKFVSMFNKIDYYYGVIDLEAFVRNVAYSIYEENERLENE